MKTGLKLDEAIKRYASNAEFERTHGNLQGCLEFRQLAKWLRELKMYRHYLLRAEVKPQEGAGRMTREEVIEVIKAYRDKLTHSVSNQLDGDIEAFDMAISALEEEPRKITYEDVKGYCKPRCLTIIDNELLYELTHPKIKTLEQEPKSPCDLCRYNPPSSADGKPCTMCPAEGRAE